jgi:hypothetical protein
MSSWRPVASEAHQTKRRRAARYRDVALSLGLYIYTNIQFFDMSQATCDIATTRRLEYIVSD